MKYFVYVTEADIVIDHFLWDRNSKTSSTGLIVYVCLLSVYIRKLLLMSNIALCTIHKITMLFYISLNIKLSSITILNILKTNQKSKFNKIR